MHFFVDGSSATANIVKKLMETVMKKLLIILSLVFICALLSAMDLDDAVTDIYSTGNLSSIGGDTYWVSEGSQTLVQCKAQYQPHRATPYMKRRFENMSID